MKAVSAVIAVTLWCATAEALTPTATPSPTPTSCGAVPPNVEPVTSPTDQDSQVIIAGGHLTGARSIAFVSPGGCTRPTPGMFPVEPYQALCQLIPGQLNEITVCINNALCGPSACTRLDRNGEPLDILQVGPAWTPSATPTNASGGSTPTPTATPTGNVTVTPTSCGADPPVVEPVTSPEIFLHQVIVAGGRVTGARYLAFSSPAGCTAPTPRIGTTYEADCQLVPNQLNEIEVCIINPACGPSACTRQDRNGNPLDILTIDVTPTATPSPPCAGDCDDSDSVTIDEIVKCINIALGFLDPTTCAACDVDENGGVDVTDIMVAVNNALDGCS